MDHCIVDRIDHHRNRCCLGIVVEGRLAVDIGIGVDIVVVAGIVVVERLVVERLVQLVSDRQWVGSCAKKELFRIFNYMGCTKVLYFVVGQVSLFL